MNLRELLEHKAKERAERNALNETVPLLPFSDLHKDAADAVDALMQRLRGIT